MEKIVVPSDLLKKESLSSLSSKEKSEYISNVLKKILELNPGGVTNSQLREATDYNDSTMWHHLEMLNSCEQCNKLQHGNVDVYSPNRVISHLNEDIEYTKGNFKYSFSVLENNYEKFIYIQKKMANKFGNYEVCSGISIPYSLIDKFIPLINKIKEGRLNADEWSF